MRITVELDRPTPRQWRRRRWAALVVLAALAVPTGAFASHAFTDVPDSHTFHGDISDAYATRLTTGCSPTTFCPDGNVTRGQMTAFLNRGLGRLAQVNLSGNITSTNVDQVLGTVTIRAGNVEGGSALVYVDALVNSYALGAGCPCEIRLDLKDQTGLTLSPYIVADMPAIPAGDNDTDVVTGIQGYAVVPTGVDRTFSVVARRTLGTAALLPYGKLDAIYIPFDGAGNPAAVLRAPAGDAQHPRE